MATHLGSVLDEVIVKVFILQNFIWIMPCIMCTVMSHNNQSIRDCLTQQCSKLQPCQGVQIPPCDNMHKSVNSLHKGLEDALLERRDFAPLPQVSQRNVEMAMQQIL